MWIEEEEEEISDCKKVVAFDANFKDFFFSFLYFFFSVKISAVKQTIASLHGSPTGRMKLAKIVVNW